jgi:hypothetical protein
VPAAAAGVSAGARIYLLPGWFSGGGGTWRWGGVGGRLAAGPARGQSGGVCIGRHPSASAVWYTGACSGHDEPELDPVSAVPGSAQDLTWTAVLPSDGSVPVSAVGPTFWWGGAVTDPSPHSLFGQAFLELQFYPGSIVNTCSSDGGFNVTQAADKFSVCSPVFQVSTQSGPRMPRSTPSCTTGRATRRWS